MTKPVATRHKPYETSQRKPRLSSSEPNEDARKRPRGSVLYRDACLQCLEKRYPEYASKIRHDFDLFVLACYDGPASGIPAYLDLQLGWRIKDLGSLEAVLKEAKESLDAYVPITGVSALTRCSTITIDLLAEMVATAEARGEHRACVRSSDPKQQVLCAAVARGCQGGRVLHGLRAQRDEGGRELALRV